MTITLALCAALLAAPNNPNPWEVANEDDGITVWTRDVPGKDVREVKAEMVMNVSSKKIWTAIEDVPHYTEFMPYVQEARVLGPAGKNAKYVYQRIDPPIVDQRDYTLRIEWEEQPGGLYFRRWKLANKKGPPPKEDVVRIKVCEGSWTLEPVGPNKTRVSYWLYTAPGGSIPTWISNRANTSSLPDLMMAVYNRAKNPKWKRN